MNSKIGIPFNPLREKDIYCLFRFYHKEIGFDEILKIQSNFPDIRANKKGDIVNVELEYVLSRFLNHYYVYGTYSQGRISFNCVWGYDVDLKAWYKKIISKENSNPNLPDIKVPENVDLRVGNILEDPEKKLFVGEDGRLKHRSLAEKVDYVVCWNKDCDIEQGIKVINLQDIFYVIE